MGHHVEIQSVGPQDNIDLAEVEIGQRRPVARLAELVHHLIVWPGDDHRLRL